MRRVGIPKSQYRDYEAEDILADRAIRGDGRRTGRTNRQLAHTVLTVCPVCHVPGPKTRVQEHLAKDHGIHSGAP